MILDSLPMYNNEAQNDHVSPVQHGMTCCLISLRLSLIFSWAGQLPQKWPFSLLPAAHTVGAGADNLYSSCSENQVASQLSQPHLMIQLSSWALKLSKFYFLHPHYLCRVMFASYFFLLSFEWTIGRQEVSVRIQPPSYLVMCFTISVFQLRELHIKIHLLFCFNLSLLLRPYHPESAPSRLICLHYFILC